MGVTNRLVFDPAAVSSSSSVGAYIRAGTDGDLIGSETLNSLEWLRVTGPIIDSAGNEVGVTSNALDVNIASGSLSTAYAHAEDAAFTNADEGVHNLSVRQDTLATSTSADGDYASMKSNAKGEIYIIDTDANALLTTIDADTGAIATDIAAIEVDIAAIEAEQLAQGTTLDSILVDTSALVVDLAAIEVDIAAIETELLAQGTSLDTIAGDTTSIDGVLTGLSKAEDSAHVSGDTGIMSLAVRNDAGTVLAGTDGDYVPLTTNASGELRVVTAVDIDDDLANTAIENTATAVSLVAVPVVSSALANRKWMYLANEGNKSLFFGKSGVTVATGFPLHPGQQAEFRIGPAVVAQIIGENGSSAEDLRVMELS